MLVSIFLKACVKDHGDSSGRSLERRIPFISMQRGALVSGFVNISVYFYKLLFDRLLKKFNILLVIRAEY